MTHGTQDCLYRRGGPTSWQSVQMNLIRPQILGIGSSCVDEYEANDALVVLQIFFDGVSCIGTRAAITIFRRWTESACIFMGVLPEIPTNRQQLTTVVLKLIILLSPHKRKIYALARQSIGPQKICCLGGFFLRM